MKNNQPQPKLEPKKDVKETKPEVNNGEQKNDISRNKQNLQLYNNTGRHTLQNKYVKISDITKQVLAGINSNDIITSGMEGKHDTGYRNGKKVYEIVHPAGLKIDVVPAGTNLTDNNWVEVAIAYIKHPAIAYVNFEDFSVEEFNRIKTKIYAQIPSDLKNKCEKIHTWFFGMKQPFLFRSGANKNTTGKHLDIGILPYSKNYDYYL